MPGFSRPMALIMPAGVSVTRGARVTGPRVRGHGLGDVGRVGEVGEVVAVVAARVLEQVERPGGVDQRVVEADGAELDGEVRSRRERCSSGPRDCLRRSRRTSSRRTRAPRCTRAACRAPCRRRSRGRSRCRRPCGPRARRSRAAPPRTSSAARRAIMGVGPQAYTVVPGGDVEVGEQVDHRAALARRCRLRWPPRGGRC